MKLLLDTHVLLWVLTQQKLSPTATTAFLDLQNQLYLSAVSYWEICIKISLGKLTLVPNWGALVDDISAMNGIQWLGIDKAHCQRLLTLPQLHSDPFDRLLIAQALTENMTLVSADAKVRQYPLATLW
ncbi:MAG: type II toxin-antitoxin system VapC family toxin [Caldilineaceae bacterium]|nr:type II toxin-antitoxin system VapC family toxin [Caldilineaceae bacterium]